MKKIFSILIGLVCLLSLTAYAGESEVTEGTLRIIGKPQLPVCPLKHTSVDAKLSGFIGRVKVTQEFINPSKDVIEAVYIFPLPNRAAVDAMTMKIGDRIIKADIKTREEAKRIYETAKTQGNRAALLEQERPNIFTQSVANIMPGDKIEITISYVEELSYQDGVYEFAFPMVVGPRFIPGNAKGFFGGDAGPHVDGTYKKIAKPENKTSVPTPLTPSEQSGTGWAADTDTVPDASRITPIVTPPGTRAGHDISLKISIESPVGLENIESILHKVSIKKDGNNAIVELEDNKAIPNKDFILKYTVSGKKVKEGLLYHTSSKNGGFFSLIVQPPNRPSNNEITPKEMIFVIDTSGSQMGDPIEKAKETMIHCIENMNSDDTFNLLDFSNKTIKLFNNPVANTNENRQKAKDFLRNKLGGGGTHMLPAVLESLQLKEDPKRLRIVCFMTDGYVGNDMEIIDSIQKNIGNSRLFSFGTGNSVNRYLIDKMAQVGKGEAEIVTLNRSAAEVAEAFQRKIGTPIMTDISIDWNGLPVSEVFPQNHPDLFSGKPLIFKGRFSKDVKGEAFLKGYIAKKPFVKKIKIDFPKHQSANDVLASLWARTKIESLMDGDLQGIQSGNTDSDIKRKIIDLGLNYNLVTQFTSFVAVEEKPVNKDGKIITVPVPVEMPDGVKYEGVFGTGGSAQNDVVFEKQMESAPASQAMSKKDFSKRNSPSMGLYSQSRKAATSTFRPRQNSYNSAESIGALDSGASNLNKLDDILSDIVSAGASGDKNNFIENGKVKVYVKLNYMSADLLSHLKSLGLKISGYSVSQKIAIGIIDIKDIKKMSDYEAVKKVEFFNEGSKSKNAALTTQKTTVSTYFNGIKQYTFSFLGFLFPNFFVALKD